MCSKKYTADDLSKQIMTRIKKEQIRVQPKWHFVVGSFMTGFGMLATLLLAIYLVSLSWFKLRMHSSVYYLWFGRDGLRAFWSTFPWIYLLLAVASLVVGLKLIKKYDFSYKMKWSWMLGAMILGVLAGGMVIDSLGFHHHVSRQTLIRPLYMQYASDQDWYKGEIVEVDLHRLVVMPMGIPQEMKIRWDEFTRLPFGGKFDQGQWVIVIGEWDGNDFKAKGIEQVGRPKY